MPGTLKFLEQVAKIPGIEYNLYIAPTNQGPGYGMVTPYVTESACTCLAVRDSGAVPSMKE